MKANQILHDEFYFVFETDRFSGSDSMRDWMEDKVNAEVLKRVNFIFNLDGTVANSDALYMMTSSKSSCQFDLKISTMKKDMHSGLGGGLVAESFRIMNEMLNNLEDPLTGQLKLEGLNPKIEESYRQSLENNFGKIKNFEWSVQKNNKQPPKVDFPTYLASVWQSSLNLVGSQTNIPELDSAGNVLRKYTQLRFQMCGPQMKENSLGKQLAEFVNNYQCLYNAKKEISILSDTNGFLQQEGELDRKVRNSLELVARKHFGTEPIFWGTGDNLGALQDLKERCGKANVLVSGVKGFDSNFCCPDENLDVDRAKKVLCCLLDVVLAVSFA